jgi:hypothetical protein
MPQVTAKERDALDTLARLYREIGISAVAAALEIPQREPERAPVSVEHLPAILRGDLAA